MLNWIPPEETVRVPENTGIDVFTNSSLEVTLSHPRVLVRNRRFRFSNMPKATKKSVREQSPPPSDDHNPTDSVEDSVSDHNQDPDMSFHPVVPPN